MYDFNLFLLWPILKTMYYYEVSVASTTYHGNKTLTYSSESNLKPGIIVKVNLRTQRVLGIVRHSVARPSFTVKPILGVASPSSLPAQLLELMDWLYDYYPAPLGSVIRQFVPLSEVIPKYHEKAQETKSETLADLPTLTKAQRDAIAIIHGPGTFLLHGITGSGKSRVYIELAINAMASEKSSLVLTPEIGLTAQLTETFEQVFKDNVYVLHSQLTAAERRTIYYRLLEKKEPVIVIGPRSALFSPIRNLGLIILDEAHDTAYKNDAAPHYQAGRVAGKLASLHNASFVLGSATPSVEDYYLAKAKSRPIVTMRTLAKQNNTPVSIEMVDLRKPELFSRNRILSNVLLKEINTAIHSNEQALIFLNRRGTANAILCKNCAWQALCPNCDLPLTYHGDSYTLRCHTCNFTTALPTSCPNCNGTDILFKSIGTKAVVEALIKLFPTARIRRFDTDTKKSERLEKHFAAIVSGDTDIIVGTQMISKGLDLPKLSVVGILNADGSLLIPDYTATERTYQLISQLIGRVGRGHRSGKVIIQTYDPENPTLLAAAKGSWQSFYESEIAERKMYGFPPFAYLLKLRVLRANNESAEKAAVTLIHTIERAYPGVTIEGPAPSFHPRERGKYSWQILVKHTDRKKLADLTANLPSGWLYDIDPDNLL
jgi:primosomal protein N' (replication factor Y) (superfamily II helicase)